MKVQECLLVKSGKGQPKVRGMGVYVECNLYLLTGGMGNHREEGVARAEVGPVLSLYTDPILLDVQAKNMKEIN